MEIGIVKQVDIDEEMRSSYLEYAMSIIVARALPDVRDGLKPVHRRILYAMYDMGLRHERPYRKSARIVGEVLGKYHPHGDAAVYDAMARMAQDFSMRYPLVDGQGNFGSIDGDRPAAMRYTEARLEVVAEEMLTDIGKETVDFVDNFDGMMREPEVLPARFPNFLVNGASGIAVGMATNIPPHNLREICDALIYLIENYERLDEISIDGLLRFIKGPDFPTGGIILGEEGIKSGYATGKGRILVRARTHIEPMSGNRYRIVVTELPYQVNKGSLLERIAGLVRSRRIDAISDMRDESDRRGMSIVIELKRGSEPRKVLNQLFKYTQMQSTFGVNMLALVDGEPRLLPLKRALRHYIQHRREMILRRTRYELGRAKRRAHILEGLKIALAQIDAVIETIRRSRAARTALNNLRRKFGLTEMQARAILDMQLRRLAALERRLVEEEYKEVTKSIAHLEKLLATPRQVLLLIKGDLKEISERYGDPRRTVIAAGESGELREEDLIPREEVFISITQSGYIKRIPASAYRARGRGGRGVAGVGTRGEDDVRHMLAASTLDNILLFTNHGRTFHLKAHQIPDAARQARGVPLSNLLLLQQREMVTAAIAIADVMDRGGYLVLATRGGRIKRASLEEFSPIRPSGIIAISLEKGDQLGWVELTDGEQEIILVTQGGQAIRFLESDVRPMGRGAAGVVAIRLGKGDSVAGMDIVREESELLVVTARGYGKRTPMTEYSRQKRRGLGMRTIDARRLKLTGFIVDAKVVNESDEVTLVSANGMVLRTPVKGIPRQRRATRGVRLMDLRKKDSVVSIARLDRRAERRK